MRRKFKVFYSKTNLDPEKAGKGVRLSENEMLVMNSDGVFFVFNWGPYYPSIARLSERIGDYDVEWAETKN